MGAPGTSAVCDERMPRYQRILLKLSGEVMAGEGSFGLDAGRMQALAEEVADFHSGIGVISARAAFRAGGSTAEVGGVARTVAGECG